MSLYEKRGVSSSKNEIHSALAKAKATKKPRLSASKTSKKSYTPPFPVYGKNSFAVAIEGFMHLNK